jgi:hypothetical protein
LENFARFSVSVCFGSGISIHRQVLETLFFSITATTVFSFLRTALEKPAEKFKRTQTIPRTVTRKSAPPSSATAKTEVFSRRKVFRDSETLPKV